MVWSSFATTTFTVECVNPIEVFMPVANYHLAQTHIDNANKTGNPIYANNELMKAISLLNEALEKLG